MEPTNASFSAVTPPPAVADTPQPPLPRPVFWWALAIAAALPVILLATLIILMVAFQYNILNWME